MKALVTRRLWRFGLAVLAKLLKLLLWQKRQAGTWRRARRRQLEPHRADWAGSCGHLHTDGANPLGVRAHGLLAPRQEIWDASLHHVDVLEVVNGGRGECIHARKSRRLKGCEWERIDWSRHFHNDNYVIVMPYHDHRKVKPLFAARRWLVQAVQSTTKSPRT
jgi:hypothetical protein